MRPTPLQRPWLPAALVLAVAVALSVLLAHWSLRTWVFQADELGYRSFAGWFPEHLPESLWDLHTYPRGAQRLSVWLWGAPLALFGVVDGFRVARWLYVLAFCSTSIPVWLWARAAGVSAWWAAVAATLSLLVPWAVVTSSFLTESVAYPAATWAALAIWNTAARPSLRADLLALGAVAVAVLARTGLLYLALVLVAVCVVQELRGRRPQDAGALRGIAAALAGLPRRHAGLAVAAIGMGIALALGASHELGGAYGARSALDAGLMWQALGHVLAVSAAGTGYVPAIVAIGLAAWQLVRPSSPDLLALALVTLALLFAVTWSVELGGPDERYVMYLAPVYAVAFVLAADRGVLGLPAAAAGAVAIVVATAGATWRPDIGPFGFFAFPAEVFQARVVQITLYERLPGALRPDAPTLTLALAVLAAGVALALAVVRGEARRRVAWAVAGALVVVGFVQATYAARKFAATAGGAPLATRAWVDEATGRRGGVGVYWVPLGPSADLAPGQLDAQYFNQAIDLDVRQGVPRGAAISLLDRSVDVAVEPRSGRLQVVGGQARIPRLMVVPRLAQPTPLAGTVIARSGYLPLDLLRLAEPARARWALTGADPDGWLPAARAARVRVYAAEAGTGRRCLRLALSAPPGLPGTRMFRAHSSEKVLTGAVTVARPTVVAIPFTVPTAVAHADVAVLAPGRTRLPDGRDVSLNVGVGGVADC